MSGVVVDLKIDSTAAQVELEHFQKLLERKAKNGPYTLYLRHSLEQVESDGCITFEVHIEQCEKHEAKIILEVKPDDPQPSTSLLSSSESN